MEIKKQPFHQLLAFQEADKFLVFIYKITLHFPKEEMYNVTSQLKRAALSVVLNIVEGQGR